MTVLTAGRKALDRLLQLILLALMLAITLIVVYSVIMRTSGNAPSWYDEIAAIILCWVTYFGAAYAALKRGHIGFEGLINVMPPPLRIAAVFLGEILVIAFFVLLGWMGMRVLRVLEGDGLVSLPWVPLQLTHSIIPVGATLFILAQLLSLPEYLAQARAGVLGKKDAGEETKEKLE
ncbi:MAG TPA: TRAP transporter small permease [Alphaproteobacteria bacterium]|jgi:TRAP-type C4-dicarboxylate transport system permease small subunit